MAATSVDSITHVLFDMDGLLLDTESFYTQVQEDYARGFGKEFTWELKAKMMGKKALEAAHIFVQELELHEHVTPEEYVVLRESKLDALFPTSPLLPGAEHLLRHLHRHGVPFALATSSHRRHFELKTTLHTELFSLFEHITTGDTVENGKPSPDIFLLTANRWDPPPLSKNCLVFEDAPSGVAAAKAAGMKCVMVPDARLDVALHEGADEVLESLLDFDPTKYGLPPFPESKMRDAQDIIRSIDVI